MLNKSGESGHPSHVPDLKGKAVSFYPLRRIFTVNFSYKHFKRLTNISSIPILRSVLIRNGCCLMLFGHQLRGPCGSLTSLINLFYDIDLQMLNHPCNLGIDLTRSWQITFLMYSWILLARILLRIVASIFINYIGLKFSFLMRTLPGVWIRVMLASKKVSGSIPSVSNFGKSFRRRGVSSFF